MMSGRDTASLETGAGAKAANNNVDDLSEVIRSLDKKAQGEFSLRLLLAARSAEQLRDVVPSVHRIFVDARAQVMEETLGNLSAFYAMFPGNHKFNVFPLWLAEDHHARLSSVFAPHIGHPHSEDLDSEYLNIFETRTRTPFFQDVYVDGVRVMLIIGPTGTGKSVHGNNLIALEQKYGGFTYIFDIGGSYESVVELYGGHVDRVGKDGPRVNAQQRKMFVTFHRAICPDGFSLELDKYVGLDPIGTTGLATKIDHGYLQAFAAAAAVGGLGGLAQIGNSGSVLSASTQIRDGISEQSAAEGEQVLNHFLNRLPIITLKEGSRARVYIGTDIYIPSYAEHRVDPTL
jgi:hypothetical protein